MIYTTKTNGQGKENRQNQKGKKIMTNEEMKMNETKVTAVKMMNANSAERKEAEKMMGCKFEDMSKEQKVLATICLAAFDGVWNRG